jgi:hypothetical protein
MPPTSEQIILIISACTAMTILIVVLSFSYGYPPLIIGLPPILGRIAMIIRAVRGTAETHDPSQNKAVEGKDQGQNKAVEGKDQGQNKAVEGKGQGQGKGQKINKRDDEE